MLIALSRFMRSFFKSISIQLMHRENFEIKSAMLWLLRGRKFFVFQERAADSTREKFIVVS